MLSESWVQGENDPPHLTGAMVYRVETDDGAGKGQVACDGNDDQKPRVFLGDMVSIPRGKAVLSWMRLI